MLQIRRKGRTHKATRLPRIVEEDQDKAGPEGGEEAQQPENETEHDARRDKVAEGLGFEEARECVALHGLEDIVFCCIEDFGIVAAVLFDRVSHGVVDACRKNDFALSSGEEVRVENFDC